MGKKILGMAQHRLYSAILAGAMAGDMWIGFQRMDRGRPFFDQEDEHKEIKYLAVQQAIESLARDDAEGLLAVLRENESNIFDEDELPAPKITAEQFLKVVLELRDQAYLIADGAEKILKAYEYLHGSSFQEIDFKTYSRLVLYNTHALNRLEELNPMANLNLPITEKETVLSEH